MAAPNSTPISPSPNPSQSPNPQPDDTSLTGPRSMRQFSLFLTGAALVSLSVFSTRRALVRRYIATVPHFFQPSNAPPRQPFSLQKEAAEALRIATVNVLSFSVMMGGGVLWAADVGSLEEGRERLRGMRKRRERSVRGGRDERMDGEVEREFGELVGKSLRKGADKEEEGGKEGRER
ncbi:MAG: hypothetical protein LQ343_000613 [Gyalolechia ehrenbergii]|nr:MAG: hypothetical protein LQ343_000613 [Gyalolechia ehrenbergii]